MTVKIIKIMKQMQINIIDNYKYFLIISRIDLMIELKAKNSILK